MNDQLDPRAQQIAALEVALQLPLPEGTLAQLQEKLRELREQRAAQSSSSVMQGTTIVSGTLHGNAVGINLGSVENHGAVPSVSRTSPSPLLSEAIDDQQELLAVHRRTLAIHLKQLAVLSSAYAPPGIEHGVREARAAIHQAKTALRSWGVMVEDLPDDEQPS